MTTHDTPPEREPLRFARADDIAGWREGLPEEFLACRDYGHLWRPRSARYMPEANGYTRTMACGRCHAERDQDLTASGGIVSGHYSYAEGYVAPRGQGRLGGEARDSLRLESVLRLLGRDSGPEHSTNRKSA